jgi:ribosomal protein S18 acetylase RimI-like enzyme
VRRDLRRQGIGRRAIDLLRDKIWSQEKRLTVEVLTDNRSGVAFWRSAGYRDYSLALEILPPTASQIKGLESASHNQEEG